MNSSDLASKAKLQSLLLKDFLRFRSEFGIHAGQDSVQELEYRHFRAEPVPYGAQFQPDIPRTDDDQMFWNFREGKRLRACANPLTIRFDAFETGRLAA